MAICEFCGIEYEDTIPVCPLCNGEEERPVSPADILDISKSENKRQLWELSMVILFSAIIIAFAVDAVFGKGIHWSLYADASLLFIASILTLTHLTRNKWIIFSSLFVLTVILLLVFSLLTKSHSWFLPLALPATASIFILGLAVVFLNSLSRYRGLNLIAVIFFALALFTLIVETCIDLFSNGVVMLRWSVAAAASLSLLALILIFIHYRLKRGRKLDSLFHV
ncbi:MAG TPA: DUF6320 domain-containing protein [Bacteroidales bacterium]|nr:DUF6320 domain-containing protein [Bacteroidales bacterium]